MWLRVLFTAFLILLTADAILRLHPLRNPPLSADLAPQLSRLRRSIGPGSLTYFCVIRPLVWRVEVKNAARSGSVAVPRNTIARQQWRNLWPYKMPQMKCVCGRGFASDARCSGPLCRSLQRFAKPASRLIGQHPLPIVDHRAFDASACSEKFCLKMSWYARVYTP